MRSVNEYCVPVYGNACPIAGILRRIAGGYPAHQVPIVAAFRSGGFIDVAHYELGRSLVGARKKLVDQMMLSVSFEGYRLRRAGYLAYRIV